MHGSDDRQRWVFKDGDTDWSGGGGISATVGGNRNEGIGAGGYICCYNEIRCTVGSFTDFIRA